MTAPPGERPPIRIWRNRVEVDPTDLPLQQAARGIAVWDDVLKVETADGTRRDLLCSAVPLRDRSGRVIGAVCTGTDVTAQIATERSLRELTATLEQRVSEALAERKIFADIVESTDAFVQVADLDFRWLAINKASADEFEAIYGVRPKPGDSMLDLLADQPEHRADVHAVWARALAGEEFTEVAAFGDPSRQRRHYEMRFSTLRDGQGRRIGAYQFVYDVTERVQNQTKLAEAQAQLHEMQKLETIGQLTGGIAHDFNNLLTPIYGALDMLHRRYAQDERTARIISAALQSTERSRVLVGRLLSFARRQHLEPRAVAVPELVCGMAELIDPSLGPLIDVKLELAQDLPMAWVDPNQLELALLNLCVNARDAMPGGGKLRIAADVTEAADGRPAGLASGRYIRLSVIDTGTGMDAETLRRAVEPFYTTKGAGKGTGLGLSMVHGLAAQSGGALALESSPGRGTTATVYLPVAGAESRNASGRLAEQPVKVRSLTILLVDDEELVRMGLADMLEDMGHRVIEAASGAAALQQLRAEPEIELLVTDYMMPSMTGVALVREARRLRPGLPALLVTGYANLDAAGAEVIPRLSKPFGANEFAAMIASVMGERKVVPITRRAVPRSGDA